MVRDIEKTKGGSMEANQSKVVTTTLILNEEEVSWLKGLMQNPLYNTHPLDEKPIDRKMRAVFLGGSRG